MKPRRTGGESLGEQTREIDDALGANKTAMPLLHPTAFVVWPLLRIPKQPLKAPNVTTAAQQRTKGRTIRGFRWCLGAAEVLAACLTGKAYGECYKRDFRLEERWNLVRPGLGGKGSLLFYFNPSLSPVHSLFPPHSCTNKRMKRKSLFSPARNQTIKKKTTSFPLLSFVQSKTTPWGFLLL